MQITGTVKQLDARIGELARDIRDTDAPDGRETFNRAFERVEHAVTQIAASAASNERACTSTLDSVARLAREVEQTASALDRAKTSAARFLETGERLIELTSDCGAETADTPFIAAVIEAAAKGRAHVRAGARIRTHYAGRSVRRRLCCDRQQQPAAGDDPLRRLDRSRAARNPGADARAVRQSGVLRRGRPQRVPAHAQPEVLTPAGRRSGMECRQLPQPAHLRRPDRLSAGRNTRRFLLQTYRRDMGGGRFVLMKDLSAPIYVQGRHWGGLRMGYQF